MTRIPLFALAALAALALAPAARAQTVLITGPHDNNTGTNDNNPNGDGYDTEDGSTLYVVPADTPDGPSATFNGNVSNGLGSYNGQLSVFGGQFTGNRFGISTSSSGRTLVYGGTFDNTTFSGDRVDHADFVTDGRVDIYGQFAGLSLGQTQTFGSLGPQSGQFTGTLQDATLAQTFSYSAFSGGTLTLHDVAPAPEPSAFVAMIVGTLGLGASPLRARRRAA